MIDILSGRCTEHGWLSEAECRGAYCLRCDEPEMFEDENSDPFECEECFDAGEWNNT